MTEILQLDSPLRTAQSRLSDDLYRLYLVALSWLLFPVYGEFFAEALPTSSAALEWVFPIAVVIAQLGWVWSGVRGGPMMVLQSSIIHELLAPVSARRTLAPQLLRQALAWGAAGAVLAGLLTSLGGEFTFTRAGQVSAAGFLVGFGATVWGVNLMVGVRATGSVKTQLVGGSIVAAIANTAAALGLGRVGSGPSLGVFGVVLFGGVALSFLALDNVAMHGLWQRARRLESARSAFLEVDLHRMLIDLRRAGESAPFGTSLIPKGRWVSGWRFAAPLRHGAPWSIVRLTSASGAALLLGLFDTLSEGIALGAFGVAWLVIGYELTRGLASLADHVGFIVHFPFSSLRLLAGQLLATLMSAAALIAVVVGWMFVVDVEMATGATILAFVGILGGAVQARLGSPPTANYMRKYGTQNASALLWLRAAAAPVLVLVTVLLAFHGYLEPDQIELPPELALDISVLARATLPAIIIAAALTAIQPLERSLQ